MRVLLAPAALLPPHGAARELQCKARRVASCRPVAAGRLRAAAQHAVVPPPPRPPRAQQVSSDGVARPAGRLVCTVAAAQPLPAPPPPSLTSTIVISLPAWLALGVTFFMAAFAGLCVVVVRELLPALRNVSTSAKSVQVACDGVVDACDEVEKLAVLMAADIKCAGAASARRNHHCD